MSALLAGAAKASIAPRAEDFADGLYLGGFGAYRQRRSNEIHDQPWCRALAVSDGNEAFVLAALDLVGASAPLLQAIREDAARLTGLPPQHILIACTHSHASPDMQGLWGGTGDGYRTHVAHRAGTAIWEAWLGLGPARIAAATAQLPGVTRNRRGWPETDDTLTVVRVTTDSGNALATLVNFACHPTASGPTNTAVSRDWCGYAVDAVERELGGIAVYVNGAIGDVNPAHDAGFTDAEALGAAVADAAMRAAADASEIGGAVRVRMRALELPLNLERLSARVEGALARTGFVLSALGKTGGLRTAASAIHAAGRPDLAQVVAALHMMSERRLEHRDGRTYLPTLCGHAGIGDDLEALAAPGEVLTRLALPLRASMGSRHRLFLGLTHDTLGYFIPEDEWMTDRNHNYEESVSPGRRAGAALTDALLELMPHHGGRA